jgi:hypothetical protein
MHRLERGDIRSISPVGPRELGGLSEQVIRLEGPVGSVVIHFSLVKASPDQVRERLVVAFPECAR